jgi:glycosyltransferase involved in cell wall biosynthesis
VKIGILTGTFHPEPGGPPTYLLHLLPALQTRGHAVRVLTFGETQPDNYGYPVRRIPRRLPVPLRLLRYTAAAFGLMRWCDVLYVQGYALPLLLLRLFLRRRVVLKVVADYSWEAARRRGLTDLDVNAFQTARHPLRLRLLRALYHRAVRAADAVIVPSQHVAALVCGWRVPPERIHIITNAIPPHDLSQADRAGLRRDLNLPLDRPLLVSVGRLTPVKGVDVALRALAHLPDCAFVIVGSGEQQPELEQLAAPYGARVIFAGMQPHGQALRCIRAADVFVLSSHTEGLSHVLLEALSVGTPVVATAVGGNPEVLSDGQNGLLVPPDDPAALAAAVRRLLDDPALRHRLADAGLRRAADFGWDSTVQHTEAILLS